MNMPRRLTLFAVLLILVMVVTSCATPAAPAAPTSAPSAAATTAPAAAPKAPAAQSGGKARFTTSANIQPPEALHGNPIAPPGLDAVPPYIWDRLIDYVPIPQDNYIPQLGESFKEDGTKLTVSLRKGVVWTDDKPFTSKDVICTYNLYFINNHTVWRYLDKLEAPDDYTVVFTWRQPSPIQKAMAFEIYINSPYHIYGKWCDQVPALLAKRDASGNLSADDNKLRNTVREDLFAFKPAVTDIVGTGPFKVSGVTTSDMLLTKKANFRDAANVKFDEVDVMRYVAQEAYITNAMAGKYDGEQHGMPPDVFDQLKKAQSDLYINWSKSGSQPGWEFNLRRYPVDNPLVRKAIITAIDFKSVLPILEPGTLDPDTKQSGLVPSFRDRFVPPDVLSKLTDYSFNKAKAEDYLKQAGWKKGADGFYVDAKGQPVTLEIASMNSWPIFFMGGQAYAEQLTNFGLKTTFKPMELAAYWQYIDNGEHMIGMDFRGNIGAYGSPWGAYKHIYRDNPTRLGLVDPKAPAGTTYKVEVKIATGETVDVLALIDQLFLTSDVNKQKEIIGKLAMAHNELVPSIAIGEKAEPIKVYAPNKKITSFPGDNEPYWFQGIATYARLMKVGKIAPK